jgi:hypothetical protein
MSVQEGDQSKPLHLRAWSDICTPKNKGSLGIRDLEKVNKSLLIHSA